MPEGMDRATGTHGAAGRLSKRPEEKKVSGKEKGKKFTRLNFDRSKKSREKGRKKMKVISILNLKGGVAKTFTAANMAYELWKRGEKVLLFDNDKQGNLSKAYNRYDAETVAPVTKLLTGDWYEFEDLCQHTEYEGLDIITANMSLFGAAWNLTRDESEEQTGRYQSLLASEISAYFAASLKKETLCNLEMSVREYYDYCIIDNPPDLGINVLNALEISDEVIVPVKICEDALEGLEIVAGQIEDVKVLNPSLTLKGILVTIYQNTEGEAAGLEWLLQGKGGYPVLGKIRYSGKVAESSFVRKPIYEYSPRCAAAQDYKRFVAEYLKEK